MPYNLKTGKFVSERSAKDYTRRQVHHNPTPDDIKKFYTEESPMTSVKTEYSHVLAQVRKLSGKSASEVPSRSWKTPQGYHNAIKKFNSTEFPVNVSYKKFYFNHSEDPHIKLHTYIPGKNLVTFEPPLDKREEEFSKNKIRKIIKKTILKMSTKIPTEYATIDVTLKTSTDSSIRDTLEAMVNSLGSGDKERAVIFDISRKSGRLLPKKLNPIYIGMRLAKPLELFFEGEEYVPQKSYKNCVLGYIIDFLTPYAEKLRIKKKLTEEYLFDLVKNEDIYDDHSVLINIDRKIDDGLSSNDIVVIAKDLGVSVYGTAYDSSEIIKYVHPRDQGGHCCLMYRTFNNHLYPITDKKLRFALSHGGSRKHLKSTDKKPYSKFEYFQDPEDYSKFLDGPKKVNLVYSSSIDHIFFELISLKNTIYETECNGQDISVIHTPTVTFYRSDDIEAVLDLCKHFNEEFINQGIQYFVKKFAKNFDFPLSQYNTSTQYAFKDANMQAFKEQYVYDLKTGFAYDINKFYSYISSQISRVPYVDYEINPEAYVGGQINNDVMYRVNVSTPFGGSPQQSFSTLRTGWNYGFLINQYAEKYPMSNITIDYQMKIKYHTTKTLQKFVADMFKTFPEHAKSIVVRMIGNFNKTSISRENVFYSPTTQEALSKDFCGQNMCYFDVSDMAGVPLKKFYSSETIPVVENFTPLYVYILQKSFHHIEALLRKYPTHKLLKISTDCLFFDREIPNFVSDTVTLGALKTSPFVSNSNTKHIYQQKSQQTQYSTKQRWTHIPEDTVVTHVRGGGSILITGIAGCGKTHFGNKILELSPETTMVLAPTNKALTHYNGPHKSTLHKFFHIPVVEYTHELFKTISPITLSNISRYKTFIVDEMSLCDPVAFVYLDALHNQGKQIILIGDFKQLKPPKHEDIDFENLFLFNKIVVGNRCELTEIRRSSDLSVLYQQILNDIPFSPKFESYKQALQCCKRHVCFTNERVREVNSDMIKKFGGGEKIYKNLPVIVKRGFISNKIIVAKNELGAIVEVGDKAICIKFEFNEYPIMLTPEDYGKNIDAAYGITCHKAQGDSINEPYAIHEWNKISSMFSDNTDAIKRWRYVGISRATKLSYIHYVE